jgi:hypothetical protein
MHNIFLFHFSVKNIDVSVTNQNIILTQIDIIVPWFLTIIDILPFVALQKLKHLLNRFFKDKSVKKGLILF